MKLVVGLVVGVAVMLAGGVQAAAQCHDPAALAAARLEVEAQCPCDGFPNHGQYVRCAREVANELVGAGLLPNNCRGQVVSCASRSTCGKPGFVTCCRTDSRGNTRCSIKKSAAQCKAPRNGSACVSTFSSCCDACVEGGCAGPTPTPTATPTPTPEPTPTPTPEPTQTPEPTPSPTPEPTPTPPYGSASSAFAHDVPSLLQ